MAKRIVRMAQADTDEEADKVINHYIEQGFVLSSKRRIPSGEYVIRLVRDL